jgi:hypothetical protein
MLLSTPREHWWGEVRRNDISAKTESMLLNKNKRSLRLPGFLGASLQGRSRGAENCPGVGDCLLLDLSKGFFAVADASDRNPTASRDFMKMFSKMLSGIDSLSADYVYEDEEIKSLQELIREKAELLMKSLSFRDGCTFTGILIFKTGKDLRGLMLHTGDSFLLACDLHSGNTNQLTKDNFWMVGRSQHFFQIEELHINSDTRLLLATDGFGNIPVPEGMSREEYVLKLFRSLSVDKIPDSFFDRVDNFVTAWDDTAIIAIDPMAMVHYLGCFILGGTSQAEEKAFNGEKERGMYMDQYIPFEIPVNNQSDNILLL